MIETFNNFLASWQIRLIGLIADASVLIIFIVWIRGLFYTKFHLKSTRKTYKIRKRDFNVQAVTNGVAKDENATHLPEEVRNEIIRITKNSLKVISKTREVSSETGSGN